MEKIHNSHKASMFWFIILHILAVLFFIPALFVTIPLHIIANILINNSVRKDDSLLEKTSYEKWVENHWNQRSDWPI